MVSDGFTFIFTWLGGGLMPLNSHDPAPPRLSPSGRHNDGLPGFGESGQLAIGQWRAHNNYLQHGPRSRSASFCVILYRTEEGNRCHTPGQRWPSPKHPYAMQVTYRNPLATMTATASQGEGQEYQEPRPCYNIDVTVEPLFNLQSKL